MLVACWFSVCLFNILSFLQKAKEAAASLNQNPVATSTASPAVSVAIATSNVTMASTSLLTQQSSLLNTGSTESLINVESLSPVGGLSPRAASPRGSGTVSSPRILHASPLLSQSPKQAQPTAQASKATTANPKTQSSISQVLQGGISTPVTPGTTSKPVSFSLIHGSQTKTEALKVASPTQAGPRAPTATILRPGIPRTPLTPPVAGSSTGPRLSRLVQQLSSGPQTSQAGSPIMVGPIQRAKQPQTQQNVTLRTAAPQKVVTSEWNLIIRM